MCHIDIFLVILANSVDPGEMQYYWASKEKQIRHSFIMNKFLLFFFLHERSYWYSKTCVKQPLKKRQNKDLNDKW